MRESYEAYMLRRLREETKEPKDIKDLIKDIETTLQSIEEKIDRLLQNGNN